MSQNEQYNPEIWEADKLHNEAMNYAEKAFIAKQKGNLIEFEKNSRSAFELELQAVKLITNNVSLEPSRSILYRSAAVLALDCREYQEAERLAAAGLAGSPPAEVAIELRQILSNLWESGVFKVPNLIHH